MLSPAKFAVEMPAISIIAVKATEGPRTCAVEQSSVPSQLWTGRRTEPMWSCTAISKSNVPVGTKREAPSLKGP